MISLKGDRTHPAIGGLPPRMLTVTIPDLFSSFLSVPLRVNPLYEEVKVESETWIAELKLAEDPKMCKKIHKLDFAYFCAIVAPVFRLDDMFDNGHLRADTVEGRQFSDTLLASMREGAKRCKDPSSTSVKVPRRTLIYDTALLFLKSKSSPTLTSPMGDNLSTMYYLTTTPSKLIPKQSPSYGQLGFPNGASTKGPTKSTEHPTFPGTLAI
ncbi:hypothetical protein BDZ45DRAFT_805767 [Acephala macrosclerotiorum]|nr:hypothetical protein BDZ45DRAFT_805767 [Acephala macrosclerotiorum]